MFAGSRGLLLEFYNDTGADWTRPLFLDHVTEGAVGITGRYANSPLYQSHRERLSGLLTPSPPKNGPPSGIPPHKPPKTKSVSWRLKSCGDGCVACGQ